MTDGIIVKTTGNSYGVKTADGEILNCFIKGNFRIRGIRSTNPVAVGDHVKIERQSDGTNWIIDLYDRKNYIIRRSTNLSKYSHIIAANVDLLVLVATVNHPVTSLVFIDRCLATAEAYRVPVCILFNKVDILSEDELTRLSEWKRLYGQLGYPVFLMVANQLQQSDASCQVQNLQWVTLSFLQNFFAGKTVLLSGNSGVGKSTLLNALVGKDVAKTSPVSSAHDKGMHTTTFSEMYDLPSSGRIIDTPGIKGFGVLDMQREEVGHYFREIFRVGRDCRYSDCVHIDEPGCAVCEAVKNGNIAFSRYESYLSMLGDITENKYR
ncbi:MAG TPA: ribosome small subunit-dependent GTPase A [Bacteroidales bacterium]|nr:ribosome small subunit-dependent GTPase A [Bacteroidales bacterium]